jgi:fatty acid desaturase
MSKYTYHSIEDQDQNMKSWFKPKIDPKILKDLTKRKDSPGWINTITYFSILIISGYIAFLTWGTWWALPAFFVYGTIYAFSNARWHEYGHRSVFKTRWLNDFFYYISSFFSYFEPVSWRWSHTHHHSRTIHQEIDYEIQVSRPSNLLDLFFLDLFGIKRVFFEFKKIFLHSLGIMTPVALDCVPENQRSKMIWSSRIFMFIKILVIVWAVLIESFLPLMFIVLPNMYGSPIFQLTTMLQHGGLRADTWDHRESTRTFIVNPIHGWLLYFNMQYHVEHHLFPQVPFYNLPKLHKAIKDQLPQPNKGFIRALVEMIPAILKQSKDPHYFISRNLNT